MAISVANYCYPDRFGIVDPLRSFQNFDSFNYDPMELGISVIDENIQRNTFGSHTSDLEAIVNQSISFCDPPTSTPTSNHHHNNSATTTKELWSTEYSKSHMGPTIVDVQTISNTTRKRPIDWENLDINSNDNELDGGSPTKIRMEKDGVNLNHHNTAQSRKPDTNGNGRIGAWADDIDFDINNELSNTSYLNNEAFLSISSALTDLKQEIPSPSNVDQQQKPSKNQTRQSILGGNENLNQLQQQNNNNSNKVINNQRNCNQDQIIQPTQSIQQDDLSLINCESSTSNHDDGNSLANHSKDDHIKFQYVLAAATSIATKNNEDTLTYLNQGQSYEIKLKKLGDLSTFRGKILKSVIKICFHERRLQYMEKEQMHQWQSARPGERIVEIDVPLSYGLCHVTQSINSNLLNTVEVLWDPMKEVGVYIKVNCISTEFTPKKHGGEKGVPFRIQVETYLDSGGGGTVSASGGVAGTTDGLLKLIHAAACQIKVFKLKGADRKHKQDREKIQKRAPSEQTKYQPSYECTILSDIPYEYINSMQINCYSPEHSNVSNKPTINLPVAQLHVRSPVHVTTYGGGGGNAVSNSTPIGINSVSSSNSNIKMIEHSSAMSPPHHNNIDMDDYVSSISKDSTPTHLAQWMTYHRLSLHMSTFAHFAGADILRMSKEDLIQICGIADGIRLHNTLHSKAITPRLKIYVSFDGSSYHAIYLHATTTKELMQKLCRLPGFPEYASSMASNNKGETGNSFPVWSAALQSKYNNGTNFNSNDLHLHVNGPSGIHVLVTDEVLNNIKDDSLFALEFQGGGKILMKAIYKNEII